MKSNQTPYSLHVQNWRNCERCPLHLHRSKVVFARGVLPCRILFIGEAPGASEDVLGKPFVGPAGELLDRIISKSVGTNYTYAVTNLVGCIPTEESGSKAGAPTRESITACRPKLIELAAIAKPELVVLVGSLAAAHIPGQNSLSCDWIEELKFVDITHPAAILRANIANQSLAIQRCIIRIQDALEELDRA